MEIESEIDFLSAKIENLLFVIWIQDQRHDFYMKFIKEIKKELQEWREVIEDGNKLLDGSGGCTISEIEFTYDLPATEKEKRYPGS